MKKIIALVLCLSVLQPQRVSPAGGPILACAALAAAAGVGYVGWRVVKMCRNGNQVPRAATYDSDGKFPVNVTIGKSYVWTDGGRNDTGNDAGTASGAAFTATKNTVVLLGEPDAVVTADLRRAGKILVDECGCDFDPEDFPSLNMAKDGAQWVVYQRNISLVQVSLSYVLGTNDPPRVPGLTLFQKTTNLVDWVTVAHTNMHTLDQCIFVDSEPAKDAEFYRILFFVE